MGRVAGKVALITGAARGMGRAHAVRLAEEGADIIALDICEQVDTVSYPMATEDDLKETARQVAALGRRVFSAVVDVRDFDRLQRTIADGIAELGRLDVVCANAGISSTSRVWEMSEEMWQQVIDINLTGVWKTVKATVPQLLEQNQGGSIILISSALGLVGNPTTGHYCAAKHGVVGLMRALSIELAPYSIRANSVHPGSVRTPMMENDAILEIFSGGKKGATVADAEGGLKTMNGLPITWLEPRDISEAVLYLASDESRYVTGATHVLDAGGTAPFKIPHG